MKTIILAGGLGTRLSEETKKIPKPMVKIGKIPIISHIINHYKRYGFSEIIICSGYKRKFIDLVDEFSDIVLNKKKLKSYNFQKLNSFEEVNKLRKKFLDEFGMYANGKNIFGEKVYQTYDIKPGKYKVKIELESGESFTDTIIVRDDPIKSN